MPELISSGVYAYADTSRNLEYILGSQLNYRASYSPLFSYSPLDVAESAATNHICIRANTGQSVENGFYWSHLSRIDPDNLTPQQQLDLEIASIGSLANQALTVAFAATNTADQALVTSWAATNTADQALSIAMAGSASELFALGTLALETAWAGTELAYTALTTAWSGTAGANQAFAIAVQGTNQAQVATTTANTAFEIAVDGTELAYTALTTAWAGTNLATTALTTAWVGTSAASTANSNAVTALTTSWVGTTTADAAFAIAVAGTEGLNEKVNRAGDTMTGSLTVPSVYFSGSDAVVSGGTVIFDFAGSASRQVFVDGTTHVTTINQDLGWNGTINPNVTGWFLHDTVDWPLTFDSRIRFVGGSAPPSTLPANQLSVVVLSVVGTTSQTFVVGAFAPEIIA